MSDMTDKQAVLVFTRQFKIEGSLYLLEGVRLTDCINEAKEFIALTDVEVTRQTGEHILTSSFLNVNKKDIEIIMPKNLASQAKD